MSVEEGFDDLSQRRPSDLAEIVTHAGTRLCYGNQPRKIDRRGNDDAIARRGMNG
jgi:hypothetical protein